jgi:Holliday junction DNA helicase RuvA
MIQYLQGTVQEVHENSLDLAFLGICFSLQVPSGYAFTKGSQVTIYTYLHWHQEQGPSLFGFATSLDRSVFLLLISCSGIGPKIGLAVLSHHEANLVLTMLVQGDARGLSQAPGVGLKKAETLIMHCRDKALKLLEKMPSTTQGAFYLKDVHAALESLGYSRQEINGAFDHIQNQGVNTFDEALRKALSYLSVRRV